MLKIIKGNIFNTKCKVLVNTVNCVGIMGKGMAFECKQRYPDMYKQYKISCDNGLIKPGHLQLWKKSEPWILNFPTKKDWKHPSKIEYLKLGLKKFNETYSQKYITSVAFPILGASLGGLEKNEVLDLMKEFLDPLAESIDIEIYEFDKTAKDELFENFYQKVKDFNSEEYTKYLEVNKIAAENLYKAIKDRKVKSMLGLQEVPQIGMKAIEKIHRFIKNPNKIPFEIPLDFS